MDFSRLLPGRVSRKAHTEPVSQITSSQELSSPYLDGRREWNERYGDYIKQKHTWQLLAFASLGIAAVALVGNVYQASQTKVRTYIVQLDKFNNPMKVTSADEAAPSDPRYVANQLEKFIIYTRSVTTDPRVQKGWLADAYAMSAPAVVQFLNDYYKKPENEPFERAKREVVTVKVSPATPMYGSQQSWQVEWEETRYSLQGQVLGRARYQAQLQAGHADITDPEKIMKNISGTIATTLSWNQRL
ncbi:hypothetical protein DBB29_12270 [Pandoraea cepalis]|uniref:Bacterial virulence protein VirB8 domain-containing protein n=1 Tax=Pandoraea cepalis TaxID=2508294 RepID=A0AAW7MH56_9BURK|nr:VirB8/TrbF family protein [Pandoraea cepalis]MDN4572044.1 hypothetical protein [Pandoraea cepalis]MDN4578890.1 hypothetical protein [Pandoraea cepalis]